ncbi:hypothetical protein [Bradyrhizobium sp. Leo170]|uniref:hypothetical protein n=1 Tax=Bradyrhizobium sp. Leo170 TaxID=1571199 RepID=UPI00102E936A|nr:hypothetical protein [Bradyrhizobium sp. Leo170]RZN14960.1 hypothetical protein CWO90_42275 [Bradyrhizobium sp. Leo121]
MDDRQTTHDSVRERDSASMSLLSTCATPDSRSRLLRRLTETAFLACVTSDVVRARRIAKGLEVIAPGSRECVIAYAVADLTAGDVAAALERLDPLAKANDAYGMAFQAVALGLNGRLSERDTVLRSLPSGEPGLEGFLTALGQTEPAHTAGKDI